MTATYSTAPTLLVAIDISKHRHEVLIGDPGKKRRRHSRSIQLKLTCQTGSRSSTAPPPDIGSCHLAGPARSFQQPVSPGIPAPLDDAAAPPAGTC
ncbi:hypothetical protein J4729_21805 [Leisingera sp. HS039]|uniref:hypothetical protein n=1 Tax=Leisingera sp. HS039 TaxID=2818496 RepID=UPI001B3A3E3B|nr:hypothetical protein [Leisingera sp. HS039]MBQ4827157.1 hypothetical protein [Leisingera sp. HS039]